MVWNVCSNHGHCSLLYLSHSVQNTFLISENQTPAVLSHRRLGVPWVARTRTITQYAPCLSVLTPPLPSLCVIVFLCLSFVLALAAFFSSVAMKVDWQAFVLFMEAAEDRKDSNNIDGNIGKTSTAKSGEERKGALHTNFPFRGKRHWATSGLDRGGGLFEGGGGSYAVFPHASTFSCC